MEEISYYISPSGDDNNDGKYSDFIKEGKGPFKTLERARDAVREVQEVNTALQRQVMIYLREGKYYLDKTLMLTSRDSGCAGFPVTYAAYPGETPVISGGKLVSGFTKHTNNILKCEISWAKYEKRRMRQLFYKHKRYSRARFPKVDPSDPLYTGWIFCDVMQDERTDTIYFPENSFDSAFAVPFQTEICGFSSYGCYANRLFVKSVDYNKRVMMLEHSGMQFKSTPWYQEDIRYFTGTRFYLENSVAMLTLPGEWCWEYNSGTLYFMPTAKDDTTTVEVVIPVLSCLIDLNGASYINLKGLTFTETDDGDNMHHIGTEGVGEMYPREGWKYMGDAVHFRNTSDCILEQCSFNATGGNAVYLERENVSVSIKNNSIINTGANGIVLAGTHLEHPRRCKITDNWIFRSGEFIKYAAGITIGYSDGNLVSHNLIENVPHHAINLGDSGPTRNIIEYNRIKWACEEVNGSGAINCQMKTPTDPNFLRCGHIIRYNYISGISANKFAYGSRINQDGLFTCGIYLGNYTSNCIVQYNIIECMGYAGIVINCGKNNFIENNLFYECLYGIRFQDYSDSQPYWKSLANFMSMNVLFKNILISQSKAYMIYMENGTNVRTVGLSDNNLIWFGNESQFIILEKDDQTEKTFEEWKRLGFDINSICEDPMLINPLKGNFGFLLDSPAVILGIEPINTSVIGPRR